MSEPVGVKCCHGGVVVQPGDTLVIAVPESDYSPAQFQHYTDEMANQLPGVKVIFVEASGLAVYKRRAGDG